MEYLPVDNPGQFGNDVPQSSNSDHLPRPGLTKLPGKHGAITLPRSATFLIALIIFLLIAGLLYVAQAILIPVALAMLLTFLLAPVVLKIQRMGVPRVAAVLIVVTLFGAILTGMTWLLASEVYGLAQELPRHEEKVRGNVRKVTRYVVAQWRGDSTKTEEPDIGELVEDIRADIDRELTKDEKPDQSNLGIGPIPVTIVESGIPGSYGIIASAAVAPLATIGLMVVLLLFMLLKREDLRNRIVTLSGRTNLAVTTKALDEAGKRIARYLMMQFIINVTYGLAVMIGLMIIGVDYALLWGVCAAFLRYIPYVGPWVAAVLPLTYSVLTHEHWIEPVAVVGMVLVLELLSNNVMEPMLYGRGVGVSEVVVILSAVFWGWLWGPVGLMLATPMTACLVVAGRYVPALSLFNRILGDVPEVETHFVYYQRLLARDEDEAQEIFDDVISESSLSAACDEVLVPTLYLLKNDRTRGVISQNQLTFILESIEEHVEEGETAVNAESKITDQPGEKVPLFLGYGAREPEDELAATIMDQLVKHDPCRFEILSNDILFSEVIERIREEQPAALCLFCMPPGGLTQTRRLCMRLHSSFPDLKIVLGRWGRTLREKQRANFRDLGVAYIGRSPTETREQVLSIARLTPRQAVENESSKSMSPENQDARRMASES